MADQLANLAIEQLADDEALRGDLTDDGFLPLQSWAFARLTRIAQQMVSQPHPETAMPGVAQQMREAVRSAVAAAESGTIVDLLPRLQPPVVEAHDAPALLASLRSLGLTTDADSNARAIAGALSTRAATGNSERHAR